MPLSSPHRRTRYLLILVRWLATTAGVYFLTLWAANSMIEYFIPKVYEATAIIQFQPEKFEHKRSTAADLVIHDIESADTLRPVIYDLELERTWARAEDGSIQAVLSDDDALARLQSMLKVVPIAHLPEIAITAQSSDPNEATDIVNAIARNYQALQNGLGNPGAVQIIDRASVPKEPIDSSIRFWSFAAVALAVVMGIMLGCFIEVILLFIRASEGEHS